MNYLIQEAAEKDVEFNPKPIVAEYKKVLNVCKLSKFKSQPQCVTFYDAFFNASLQEQLTFDQWVMVYNTLLSDHNFTANLCLFVAMWQPTDTKGMFYPIVREIDSEFNTLTKNRVRFLSDAKAFFQYLTYQFDSISNTVLPQTQDQAVVTFLTTVKSVTNNFVLYYNDKILREIGDSADPNAITMVVRGSNRDTLEEDARELIELLENGEQWINEYCNSLPNTRINESVVNKAVEAAKVASMKRKKAEDAFNDVVMKKVREIRTNRRNRRHAEVVGESLRITKWITRILRSGGLSIISPAIGIISFLIPIFIDKKTKISDRAILIKQIEDELEIMDEKISQAERNGDDKGKIELLRAKQKLKREYERISRKPLPSN